MSVEKNTERVIDKKNVIVKLKVVKQSEEEH